VAAQRSHEGTAMIEEYFTGVIIEHTVARMHLATHIMIMLRN
jgi:hypothetical protein